jgi:hypothetical protein
MIVQKIKQLNLFKIFKTIYKRIYNKIIWGKKYKWKNLLICFFILYFQRLEKLGNKKIKNRD